MGRKSAHRGLHGGLCCEAGFGHIQLQFSELLPVKNNHSRIDGQDCVEVVALPFHSAPIKIAAWFYSDESCFQKNIDAFQRSVFGQTSISGDGVVAGVAGVHFAILNQQQISVDHERREREFQQEDFVRKCEKVFTTVVL